MARSKEFDVDSALRKAMNLFWQQGYEKTSMADLVAGMGVHKRSMYDTFGDKHALYMKVMERYDEAVDALIDSRIHDMASAKQAIRFVFEMAVNAEELRPKGCLMVNTAVELALHDSEAMAKVNENFSKAEALFCELIVRGQRAGEIAGHHDAARLSQFLINALLGLRVMVKTTDDQEKLNSIIDTTLSVVN